MGIEEFDKRGTEMAVPPKSLASIVKGSKGIEYAKMYLSKMKSEEEEAASLIAWEDKSEVGIWCHGGGWRLKDELGVERK